MGNWWKGSQNVGSAHSDIALKWKPFKWSILYTVLFPICILWARNYC